MPHMDFTMRRPCPHCPFRSDREPYLPWERAKGILESLRHKTFACHETTNQQPRDQRGRFTVATEQHCAGALILMELEGWRGDMQQIAQRLGLYDPSHLDLTAPVYPSGAAMVSAFIRTRAR